MEHLTDVEKRAFKEKVQRVKDWMKEYPTYMEEIKKKFLVSIYLKDSLKNQTP